MIFQEFLFKKYSGIINATGNLGIFLFFSLVLSTENGHSLAILLMLLAGLLAMPLKREIPIPTEVKYCVVFLIGLALFWSHTFDSLFSFSFKGDSLVRYGLGALCILGFSKLNIHPRSIFYGFAVGGGAAVAIALVQYNDIGRAEGFTNAIRFGNLNLLMGLACFAAFFIKYFKKSERFLFLISSVCLFTASILSLSRGGWPMFSFVPIVAFFLLRQHRKYAVYFSLGLLSLVLAASTLPPVENRISQAHEEITGYFSDREKYVETSVGARLEMWVLAIAMGAEKPLTGWGDTNVHDGRVDYVEKSRAHPFILNFKHAHNELLQMWASRGFIGVMALLLIYFVPVYLVFIAYKKNKKIILPSSELKDINRLLYISGIMIFIGYFIFGLSDWFFTFVIGRNFYLFALIAYLSAMLWVRRNGMAESSASALKLHLIAHRHRRMV